MAKLAKVRPMRRFPASCAVYTAAAKVR